MYAYLTMHSLYIRKQIVILSRLRPSKRARKSNNFFFRSIPSAQISDRKQFTRQFVMISDIFTVVNTFKVGNVVTRCSINFSGHYFFYLNFIVISFVRNVLIVEQRAFIKITMLLLCKYVKPAGPVSCDIRSSLRPPENVFISRTSIDQQTPVPNLVVPPSLPRILRIYVRL